MRTTILLFLIFTISNYAQEDNSKYPDLISNAYYSGKHTKFSSFYGGTQAQYPIPVSPKKVLDNNSEYFISLPQGSFIIYQYTDNAIVDAPNQDDIIIIENGCCRLNNSQTNNAEKAIISVSENGKEFYELGIVDDCKKNTLDLNNIQFKQRVHFIKIEGLDTKCYPQGFDLINAYALPDSNYRLYLNMENAQEFFDDDNKEKILVLDHIYFENDAFTIQNKYQSDLNHLVDLLKENDYVKIQLTGHTDANASEDYNQVLSEKRAKAVYDYLIQNKISPSRIQYNGKGEIQPFKSNATAKGRAYNRRVEVRRID